MLQVCDPTSGRKSGPPFWALVAPAVFILLWSGGATALKAGLAFAEPSLFGAAFRGGLGGVGAAVSDSATLWLRSRCCWP